MTDIGEREEERGKGEGNRREALLRFQSGPMSGLSFLSVSSSSSSRFPSSTCLGLPVPVTSRTRQCACPLEVFGHHRAACSRSGIFVNREYSVESAAVAWPPSHRPVPLFLMVPSSPSSPLLCLQPSVIGSLAPSAMLTMGDARPQEETAHVTRTHWRPWACSPGRPLCRGWQSLVTRSPCFFQPVGQSSGQVRASHLGKLRSPGLAAQLVFAPRLRDRARLYHVLVGPPPRSGPPSLLPRRVLSSLSANSRSLTRSEEEHVVALAAFS